MNPLLLLVMFGIPMISQWVASRMQARFVQFSQDPLRYSGAQIAAMMLRDEGISDVEIMSTQGQLTDHYDPRGKTVNLSQVVYGQSNVAAAAVAAHECGHAVQHATRYPLLTARSKLVPLLQISNQVVPILALSGAGVSFAQGIPLLTYLFLGALGLPALFALVTLPVEFDASRRALKWMESSGLVVDAQLDRAKKALFWAAMTYVISALGAIAQLLYYAQFFLGNRRRREY